MTNEHSHDDDIIIGPGFAVLPFKESEEESANESGHENGKNGSVKK